MIRGKFRGVYDLKGRKAQEGTKAGPQITQQGQGQQAGKKEQEQQAGAVRLNHWSIII